MCVNTFYVLKRVIKMEKQGRFEVDHIILDVVAL